MYKNDKNIKYNIYIYIYIENHNFITFIVPL